MSTPASSTITALGGSYAVTMTMGSPSARISPSFVSVTGLRWGGAAGGRGGEDMLLAPFVVDAGVSAGRHRCSYGFQRDVVDQADGADARGHGQHRRAVEARQRLEALGIHQRDVFGRDR